MSLELWIPHSARPKLKCPCCAKPFYEGEERAFNTHVRRCAREHHEQLRGAALASDPEHLLGEAWAGDTEYEDWVRANGRVK